MWRAAEADGAVSRIAGRSSATASSISPPRRKLAETAAKHFAGQSDLILVAVDAEALGPELKWERSRGGDLFPHLYAALPLSAVRWARPLPDEIDGRRPMPELEP